MLPSAMVEMISVVVVSHEIYLRSKISGHKSFICRKCKCLLFLSILNKKRAWQSFESKLFISSKLHLKTRKKSLKYPKLLEISQTYSLRKNHDFKRFCCFTTRLHYDTPVL